MKNLTILLFLILCMKSATAQFNVGYDPNIQPRENLQYFTPSGDNLFVGDCIPYYHQGTWYLYWFGRQRTSFILEWIGRPPVDP